MGLYDLSMHLLYSAIRQINLFSIFLLQFIRTVALCSSLWPISASKVKSRKNRKKLKFLFEGHIWDRELVSNEGSNFISVTRVSKLKLSMSTWYGSSCCVSTPDTR
jgi:hypothetical protein